MTTFNITCYPNTDSETTIKVEIATVAELSPTFAKANNISKYAYGYRITGDNGTGHTYFGGDKESIHAVQAQALLRAASWGNGGFPLDHSHYRA